MQTRAYASLTPTVLYVDYRSDDGINQKRLEGVRRYAATRKWRVATLAHETCSPEAMRKSFQWLRPVGCVAECWNQKTALPPALFGQVPVVYFGRRSGQQWRGARVVECDDAAVSRMAFQELSASNPPAYAVVSANEGAPWAERRIDAFRDCCRKAGFDCPVTFFPAVTARRQFDALPGQMSPWAKSLPQRCAVFAVNDDCAFCVAHILAAAGRSFPSTVTLVGADGSEPWRSYREIAQTVSSIRLDFEMAGYMAAKAIAQTACRQPPAARPEAPLLFPPLLVDRRKSTRGFGRKASWILEAMDVIRGKACDGLEPADLPARFGVSRRNFDRRFREAMGHSAQDEIERVRMERVFELLRDPDTPIGSIAALCGWRTGIALSWLFRRRTGMTMRDWRKKMN